MEPVQNHFNQWGAGEFFFVVYMLALAFVPFGIPSTPASCS